MFNCFFTLLVASYTIRQSFFFEKDWSHQHNLIIIFIPPNSRPFSLSILLFSKQIMGRYLGLNLASMKMSNFERNTHPGLVTCSVLGQQNRLTKKVFCRLILKFYYFLRYESRWRSERRRALVRLLLLLNSIKTSEQKLTQITTVQCKEAYTLSVCVL